MDEDSPRNGVAQAVKTYGAVAASVIQFAGVLLYIAHWQATVDQRLSTVENSQVIVSSNMSRLDVAREADQLHLAHVDDRLGDMSSKVSAMFNIMTQPSPDPDPAEATPPPIPMPSQTGNFPRPQGRKN